VLRDLLRIIAREHPGLQTVEINATVARWHWQMPGADPSPIFASKGAALAWMRSRGTTCRFDD
jgi:hypothetical protein